MINFPLFKQNLKSNYKIVLIFMVILTIYIMTIVGMYDPNALSLLEGFTKEMPELMSLFGMNNISGTLLEFLITYLYGFLFLILPLIITIIISNKLVASHVDKGTASYLLASPNKRKKIILSQLALIKSIILVVMIYCTVLTLISANMFFPNELEVGKFLLLNFHLLVFHFFLASISFLSSTIFNETKYSLMFGAGIPFVFYLIQMLSNMGGRLENLKYFTIFNLFDPYKIISGTNNISLFILIILTISLNLLAIKIFEKKNIPV